MALFRAQVKNGLSLCLKSNNISSSMLKSKNLFFLYAEVKKQQKVFRLPSDGLKSKNLGSLVLKSKNLGSLVLKSKNLGSIGSTGNFGIIGET